MLLDTNKMWFTNSSYLYVVYEDGKTWCITDDVNHGKEIFNTAIRLDHEHNHSYELARVNISLEDKQNDA